MDLNTQMSTIRIDSTTEGWNIGSQLNGGFWSPTGPISGITVSGGYSTSTTKTIEKTVSESTDVKCDSGYSCWTEAWLPQLVLNGTCKVTKTMQDANGGEIWSTASCPLGFKDEGIFECEQWAQFKEKACKEAEEVKDCTVHTPLLESDGSTPMHIESGFRLPIPGMWEKPVITGYRAGLYELRHGQNPYIAYDPSREEAKYMDKKHEWHYYEAYPEINDQVKNFKHPHPKINDADNEGCYLLDSDEWFCKSRQGDDRYFVKEKGYYAKPGAPLPTFEEMDKADRQKLFTSENENRCRHQDRECVWVGAPAACGVDQRKVGTVDSLSANNAAFEAEYVGKLEADGKDRSCKVWLGEGSSCCNVLKDRCESGFRRLWCRKGAAPGPAPGKGEPDSQDDSENWISNDV